MSKYKGLFTYDIDNHRYLPIEQADGLISDMNYCPEPKKYWYIDYGGRIKAMNDADDEEDVARKEIGNYFSSREEAEKAVEKLQSWKKLKDTITRIDRASFDDVGTATLFIRYKGKDHKKVQKLLNLLFGGEE